MMVSGTFTDLLIDSLSPVGPGLAGESCVAEPAPELGKDRALYAASVSGGGHLVVNIVQVLVDKRGTRSCTGATQRMEEL